MEIFQDQSHINQVRDALWARQGSGASVMVGSGFSKNSLNVRPDGDAPPMLHAVAEAMHKRLYPRINADGAQATDSESIVAERIPSLAQEYKTAFGRGNLHQLLQQLIRDDDLKPGEAHIRLLQLPWRDVFTTNWDTLLEKTRPHIVERTFSVVRDMDEIPLAHKPRIVKLHGSLPAQFPLIFTEEDYRTYPTKFAPFVNTVQQAMMETVFCLIGFSGNDPNFLSWSGWVRDHLGDSAPKIYLAGWLDLSDHRRNVLQRRGVLPIDLARHPRAHEWPEHQHHHYATEWVLHTLERGRPYDVRYWPSAQIQPYKEVPEHLQPVVQVISKQPKEEPWVDRTEPEADEDELLQKVNGVLAIWQHNRLVYPGWLLLPAGEERETLRSKVNGWEPLILDTLPSLEPVERLNAIYELVWRREILLEPISDELELATENVITSIDCQDRKIDGVDESNVDWSAVRIVWRNVALSLVTAARFRLDAELFDKRTKLLAPFENDHPDVYHRLKQERCLQAVYSIDFETLEILLDDWTVTDCDPIWMIRKAALLWESVRNDEAAESVKHALDSIRAIPDEIGSVAGASREGWALWSAYSLDNRQEISRRWDELAAYKCDAMLETDIISRQISGTEESQETPSFDLGIRRVQGLSFSSWRPEIAAYRAIRLSEIAGMPPVTRHSETLDTPVASATLKPAAEALATIQPELAIRLVLRVSDIETDKTLNRVLPRPQAANLSEASADLLSDICIDAIGYAFPRLVTEGRRKRSFPWIARMRVLAEILSRLALRVSHERVEAILDLGLQCFQSHEVAQEPWLHSSTEHLLRRSWEALPKDRRSARAVELLRMPIVGMDSFSANIADRFPDPGGFLNSEDLPAERTSENDSQWHETISFLIRGLEGDAESRKRAASRIMRVSDNGLLTDSESSEIAQALWSDAYTPVDDLPLGIDLFDWAFLLLPEPHPGIAEERFRLKWFSSDTDRFQSNTQRDNNTVRVSLGARPVNPNKIEDVLWNIGTAMSGLRHHGQPLQLTDGDCKFLLDLVELWVNSDIPSHPVPYIHFGAREPTVRALHGLASILDEVVIPIPAGNRLYEKLKTLTDSGTPGFESIHGLAKTALEKADELAIWLRMGLASNDETVAASAILGLRNWLTASVGTETSPHPPPKDLLREIGFKIASRSSVALPQALQLATWVFREGTSENQHTVTNLVIQGLSYLAEELRYDREHKSEARSEILPLLRLSCAQLAQAMAQSGLRDEPAVDLWLTLGKEDPLPEVRYTVTSLAENDEAG